MKRKQWILPIALFMVMPLNSCGLFEGLFETDTDTNHVTSYDKSPVSLSYMKQRMNVIPIKILISNLMEVRISLI